MNTHSESQLSEEAKTSIPFTKTVSGPVRPSTRLIVRDAKLQEDLDRIRDAYEAEHGEPVPNGLWAHQLSLQERKLLSAEELERRIAPWLREFFATLIAKAIMTGRIDDLPDYAISFVMEVFGRPTTGQSQTPPNYPPPA
jgi:hypothetical protein